MPEATELAGGMSIGFRVNSLKSTASTETNGFDFAAVALWP